MDPQVARISVHILLYMQIEQAILFLHGEFHQPANINTWDWSIYI